MNLSDVIALVDDLRRRGALDGNGFRVAQEPAPETTLQSMNEMFKRIYGSWPHESDRAFGSMGDLSVKYDMTQRLVYESPRWFP